MHINELLPISPGFEKIYNDYVQKGKNFLSKQNICIVGLTRNTSQVIFNTINSLVELGESAQNYKIVLFENDSTDDTVSIINEISKTNNNLHLMSQNYNRIQFGPVQDQSRTLALAEYRNILKNHVACNYLNYHFTIVVDTDFQNFSLDGVYNSFGWLENNETIGAICGNSFEYKMLPSLEYSLWNYDSWAYRGSWWDNLQAYNIAKIAFDPMTWFGLQILPIGSSPFRVNSAFGGMSIYRNHFFINGNYGGEDCEHVIFHHDLKSKNPNFNLFLNPSQRMLVQ